MPIEHCLADINECAEFGHCDQVCENKGQPQQFNCKCHGDCWTLDWVTKTPEFNVSTRGYCKSRNPEDLWLLIGRREGLYKVRVERASSCTLAGATRCRCILRTNRAP